MFWLSHGERESVHVELWATLRLMGKLLGLTVGGHLVRSLVRWADSDGAAGGVEPAHAFAFGGGVNWRDRRSRVRRRFEI
jgi:hypothetical protein